ncbi:MAG: hypothetical protein RSE00_01220 [Clostridia bacterium]
MDNLNQIELQNIRHICGHGTNICDKITYYKTLTQDKVITDALDRLCTEFTSLKSELCTML